MPVDLKKLDWEKIKEGIRLALPLLKLLAARTKTDLDDQAVLFLEALLADPATAALAADLIPVPPA